MLEFQKQLRGFINEAILSVNYVLFSLFKYTQFETKVNNNKVY